MTENELRQKVVETMRAWIGLNEYNNSHKKIVDIYNSHRPLARGYQLQYSDAWCAGTVSAAAIVNGLTDIMPTEVSVGYMIGLYQQLGRWMENDAYTPKPGDVIMYYWSDSGVGDCTSGSSHVGIVEKVESGMITVIEGNKDNAVGRRTIAINGRYIRGYGLPDYASKADTKQEKEEKEMRYQKVKDLPESLQAEAQELIDMGVLCGVNDAGDLDVTLDMIRCMIINLRLYKKYKA